MSGTNIDLPISDVLAACERGLKNVRKRETVCLNASIEEIAQHTRETFWGWKRYGLKGAEEILAPNGRAIEIEKRVQRTGYSLLIIIAMCKAAQENGKNEINLSKDDFSSIKHWE